MKLYVLTWTHSDGSSYGVARVYADKERADSDCKLLNEHSTVAWGVIQADYFPHCNAYPAP
jgi:hypothetical protein